MDDKELENAINEGVVISVGDHNLNQPKPESKSTEINHPEPKIKLNLKNYPIGINYKKNLNPIHYIVSREILVSLLKFTEISSENRFFLESSLNYLTLGKKSEFISQTWKKIEQSSLFNSDSIENILNSHLDQSIFRYFLEIWLFFAHTFQLSDMKWVNLEDFQDYLNHPENLKVALRKFKRQSDSTNTTYLQYQFLTMILQLIIQSLPKGESTADWLEYRSLLLRGKITELVSLLSQKIAFSPNQLQETSENKNKFIEKCTFLLAFLVKKEK